MAIKSHAGAPSKGSWWGMSERCLHAVDAEVVILVVDDDPVSCRMVSELLDDAGYAVEWTSDPAFALERAQKRPYALVIADVNMPFVSGPELVSAMRRRRPDLGALLVSAASDAVVRRQAHVFGVGFLPKPFGTQSLVSTVHALLAQRAQSVVP